MLKQGKRLRKELLILCPLRRKAGARREVTLVLVKMGRRRGNGFGLDS